MVFTHPLNDQQLGPSAPRSFSKRSLIYVFVGVSVCVQANIFEQAGSAIAFVVLHYSYAHKMSNQMLLVNPRPVTAVTCDKND